VKILLLTHLFNSLAQRLFVELCEWGHEVTVEFDIADAVTEEAVALARPDLVLAPFMKRRIPESVWSRVPCLVVHPGIPGDGGPSALDHAILAGERDWGVTVLQATGDFDAGPLWAWAPFAMRDAPKGELYRCEVVDAAVRAVRDALARFRPGAAGPVPAPAWPVRRGQWQPLVRAAERALDWSRDGASDALRKIRSADGHPGVTGALFGIPCRLFDAHPATPAALCAAPAGAPGAAVARRGPALLVRTHDGGLWIGHVRRDPVAADRPALKLAATRAFALEALALPELPVPLQRPHDEWDELRYRELGPDAHTGARVGWLEFEFHNGAMSARQCERLSAAIACARERATQVLVLAGGAGFFSNGIHLHDIEAAADVPGDSAADASWRNINAIDDVALAILGLTDRLTLATLRGNAGAGGCFLALAADEVWAHAGVVLNPHYKNMGNLYGSEYWTYLLPRRVGGRPDDGACRRIMQGRLPIGVREALALKLVDRCLANGAPAFEAAAEQAALALAATSDLAERIAAKAARRVADEAVKPLAAYRAEELARMQRNFYGFDPSYHVARHHFVARKPQAWTPRHLARHRDTGSESPRASGVASTTGG
jgi:putative two-component system protein, hydrogenase maturation factor HypX/HoxX